MISEVVMPQMGADMTEGTLIKWLKSEGEEVTRGEIIAEIETDKANVEIEAFGSGVFRVALAHEGDTVNVGEVIAVIAAPTDDISKYAANGAAPVAQSSSPTAGTGESAATRGPQQPPTALAPHRVDQPRAPANAPADGRVRASPLAKRIADERSIDLRQVQGSGPGGRIVRKDVESAASAAVTSRPVPQAPSPGAPARTITVAPSKMRQAIARRMSQSKREAPHYYLLVNIDMTEALSFRAQFNGAVGEDNKASINDLIVRASALALQRHPEFNATIANDQIMQHGSQHVCIGIALDEGLIAPAILDVGAKTLAEIAIAGRDLIDRAKNGRLKPDEMAAGTFTISNLGSFGIETLVAIIQPPQTAILGIGAVTPQPVVREGTIVVRQMMKVALSADHRVTDGAQGAAFLAEIKNLLEKPLLLVL